MPMGAYVWYMADLTCMQLLTSPDRILLDAGKRSSSYGTWRVVDPHKIQIHSLSRPRMYSQACSTGSLQECSDRLQLTCGLSIGWRGCSQKQEFSANSQLSQVLLQDVTVSSANNAWVELNVLELHRWWYI